MTTISAPSRRLLTISLDDRLALARSMQEGYLAIAEDRMFAVCVDNADYPASLDARKPYEVLPDEKAASHRQLRVVDESGED
jgi:hypothetical protein